MPHHRLSNLRLWCAFALALLAGAAAWATIYATPLEGVSSLSCGHRFFSCGETLSSSYAKLGEVPVGAVAVGYFAWQAMLIAALALQRSRCWRQLITWLGLPGLLISLFYLVVMTGVLRSFCLYCLLTHALHLGMLALLWRTRRWKPAPMHHWQGVLLAGMLLAAIGIGGVAFWTHHEREQQAQRYYEQYNKW